MGVDGLTWEMWVRQIQEGRGRGIYQGDGANKGQRRSPHTGLWTPGLCSVPRGAELNRLLFHIS